MADKKPKCYNCKHASDGFKVAGKTHHQCNHPKHNEGFENGTLSPWDTLREWYLSCDTHEYKLEQGKGIIHQIEDKKAPYGSVEGELTEQKLMSFLQDIMGSPDAPKPMVMLTGCIEKGIVTQSSEQFNLCNNPDCKTCRNLEDALKEQ